MEAKGYPICETYFEQENESPIKMEKNGQASAKPKSRHSDIPFFWMKDRIKTANVTIRHCPTLQMITDFFTKPLQGNLFCTFRDVILRYKHANSLRPADSTSSEERVGKDICTEANACRSTGNIDSAITDVLKTNTNVTWADVVKKGLDTSGERKSKLTDALFREVILSKQSSS